MKRKYWFIIGLAAAVILITVVLLLFPSETKEYSIADLTEQYDTMEALSVGGTILKEDLRKYRIVCDDYFTEEEMALAEDLRDMIYEHTGVSLSIHNTFEGKRNGCYTIGKHELLLGYTNRPESLRLADQTWDGGASCSVIGEKLVLSLGTQMDRTEGLRRFLAVIENNLQSETKIFFADTDAYVDIGNAPVRSLLLNDLPITDYSIVIPVKSDSSYYKESAFLAEVFRQKLGDICGYLLPLQDLEDIQSTTPGIIYAGVQPSLDSMFNDILGDVAEAASWTMSAENTTVHATGTASYCAVQAIDALLRKLTPPAPADEYRVQIDSAEPVPTTTDISLLRVEMFDQWPAITLMEDYVYDEFPDLFVFEHASDSLGGTFEDNFAGYYTCHAIGYSRNVYYCSSRFSLVDEGEIRIPEDAETDAKLHVTYFVLKDLMNGEEITVFTSDVTKNSLDEFKDTVDYLSFADRKLVYLGNNVPDKAVTLFSDAVLRDADGVLDTMFYGEWKVSNWEDRTDDIIGQQEDNAVIWSGRCDAHMIYLEYADN